MEDNIEIFNNRMYEKGIGLMHLGGFKKTRKRKNTLVLLEEEYFLVLKEIEKIERWLNIIDDAEKIIRTEFVLQTMDRQKEQLNKVKSEYIDYKFDPKWIGYTR